MVSGLFNAHRLLSNAIRSKAGPSNKAGPDLITAIAKDKPSIDWLKVQLTTPQQHNPVSMMPSFFSRLTDDQMNDMVEFLKQPCDAKADSCSGRRRPKRKRPKMKRVPGLHPAVPKVFSLQVLLVIKSMVLFYFISRASCAMALKAIPSPRVLPRLKACRRLTPLTVLFLMLTRNYSRSISTSLSSMVSLIPKARPICRISVILIRPDTGTNG